MRKPSASSATPSVICQLAIVPNRPTCHAPGSRARRRDRTTTMTTKTAATAAISQDGHGAWARRPGVHAPPAPPPKPRPPASPRARRMRRARPGRRRPAGRQGPGRTRPRTGGRRRLGAEVLEPARLEAGHVRPDARLERLVVGDAVGVGPDELHQRRLAVGPDEVVDRRHALGVGQRELLARRRELAGQPVERDDRVGPDAPPWWSTARSRCSPRTGRPRAPR